MRFIRRSAGIQLVPARGFLHEARAARNRPCSPVKLVKLVRADFGGFVRVCCFCRCVCLPGRVSMAAKRCQQASCLGGAEWCQEWHCCKAKIWARRLKSRNQLDPIDRSSLCLRNQGLNLAEVDMNSFCKQVECATSEVRNTARWKFVGYHV